MGRGPVNIASVNLGERLIRMMWGEVRAVHLVVVWMVWAGAEVDVDDPNGTVRLVEEGTENAGEVVAGLQLVP